MWDQRYDSNEYYYGTEPNDFLRDCVGLFTPGGQILSLGEGEGRNAVFMASRGLNVTAVDGSHVATRKLAGLARERGVHVAGIVEDLRAFSLGEAKWDGIVSIWCHLPKNLRVEVLKRSVKALRPGGFLLIESYIPRQVDYKTGGPADIDMLPTLTEFLDHLMELDLILGRELDRNVYEGVGHHGMSAVVQFIGRRPLRS